MDDDSEGLFAIAGCQGTLSWREHRLSVSFDLSCDRAGVLAARFAPVTESAQTRFLGDMYFSKGPFVEEFGLEGVGPAGQRVRSTTCRLTLYGTHYKRDVGSHIEMEAAARACEVDLDSPPAARTCVQYLLPGVPCFGTPNALGKYGNVWLAGPHSPTDRRALRSHLTFEIDRDDPDLVELDRQAARVLTVLSIGCGRHVAWPVRQVFVKGRPPAILVRMAVSGGEHGFPLFSHLNWQPAMEAAVARYAPMASESTGLRRVVAWMLMRPVFSEGDFLTRMVALEHIAERHRGRKGTAPLDRNVFRSLVLPALEQTLRETLHAAGEAGGESETVLLDRLKRLNSYNLRRLLVEGLAALGTPTTDLQDDIPKLVKVRNDFVHGGSTKTPYDQVERLHRVLYELLCRVVMTILGYRGGYNSFLDGYQFRQFPFEVEAGRAAAAGTSEPNLGHG